MPEHRQLYRMGVLDEVEIATLAKWAKVTPAHALTDEDEAALRAEKRR